MSLGVASGAAAISRRRDPPGCRPAAHASGTSVSHDFWTSRTGIMPQGRGGRRGTHGIDAPHARHVRAVGSRLVFVAIAAPCATVIMAVDRFALPRLPGISRPTSRHPVWQQTAVATGWRSCRCWPRAPTAATAGDHLAGPTADSPCCGTGEPIPPASICYPALAAAAQDAANPQRTLRFPTRATHPHPPITTAQGACSDSPDMSGTHAAPSRPVSVRHPFPASRGASAAPTG